MEVHLNKPGTTVPGGTAYIVGKNGTFLQLEQSWVRAVVPVKECLLLDEVRPSVELLLPPIDAATFAKAARFFAKVYKLHSTEAYLLLHYSSEHGYAISAPPQEVSFGAVHADMTQRIEGYRCVGTMHSHGDMEAYHSGVDQESEADFDGIHITIGRLPLLPYLSIDAEVVVRGHRAKLPDAFIEGLEVVPTALPAMSNGIRTWQDWYRWRNIRHRCAINAARDWTIPEEWLHNVRPRFSMKRNLAQVMTVGSGEGVNIVPRFMKAVKHRYSKWTKGV